jgi:biopolymer transport protein ExbB/TolQ
MPTSASSHLYHLTTQLFYQLSNAFFWPVAIALLALFAATLIDLGALLAQIWRRRRQPRTDIAAVARVLLAGLNTRANAVHAADTPGAADDVDALAGLDLSPALRRFWTRVRAQLGASGTASEHLDLWLEDALQEEEMAVTSQLDLSRVLIRIGPMLGLAGTIIPLGPALESLLSGSMADMVSHLVIGFGAVVVGLVLSGISYFTTLVRERWMRRELKDLESLCELIMRGVKTRPSRPAAVPHAPEAAYARV